jgi:hypothetical protein
MMEQDFFLPVLNTVECEHTKDSPLMVCGVIDGKGEVIKRLTDIYSVSGEITILSAPYTGIVWIKTHPHIGMPAQISVVRRKGFSGVPDGFDVKIIPIK